MLTRWPTFCAALLCALHFTLGATPARADQPPFTPAGIGALGTWATYLEESAGPLSLEQAVAARLAGRFGAGRDPVPGFGLGARPVWVHLPVTNRLDTDAPRLLLIESGWLDHLDIYLLQNGRVAAQYRLGDTLPHAERPTRGRFFSVPHSFPPGATDIYLRAASPDPLVLPIFLLSAADAAQREQTQSYSYGFLYGYFIALLAYNAILYLSLRDMRHLSYAAYLAMFILVNIAYTGHGFAWLWPEAVGFQRWIIPVLMVLYCGSGLVFARYFLDTPTCMPRTHRLMTGAALALLLLTAAAVLFGPDQLGVLVIAFVSVAVFSVAMPVLGLLALRAGQPFSRYFLFATTASMLGTALTTFSVLGFVPISTWKYRAAEIGMLIDATLLALALGSQFRLIKTGHLLAEERAARDPLTDLRNRRSFLELAQARWTTTQRSGGHLSLIMLDLDHFKSINDQHGHAAGDAALVAAAQVLANAVRDQDLVARWGGEEFLILLPETAPDAALALAERLRVAIATLRVRAGTAEIALTASFGVAHRTTHENLDRLISEADGYLYQSKQNGRNRISAAGVA